MHNWDYVSVSNRMQSRVLRLTISYNHIFSSPESSRRAWLAVHVTSELSNTSFNTRNAALNCLLAAGFPFIGACTLGLAYSGLLFTQSSGTLSGIPPNLSPPVLRRLNLRRQIDGPLRDIVSRRRWLGIRVCLWLVALLLRLRVKGRSSTCGKRLRWDWCNRLFV